MRGFEVSDMVNRPPHYTGGEIECVDASRSSLTAEEFRGSCKAQAQQYIWRERQKGGDEDLRKAIWWLRMAVGDDPRKER
jgi:hypothetical protein